MVGSLRVEVLGLVTVLSVVDWVLVAVGTVLTSVVVTLVGWLVVNVLAVSILVVVSLMGDHGVVFVTDWTGVGLVLELDVRLLLVVFLVVRVEVSGHFVVDGVLMNNLWVVVVLVVSHALDEVVRLFVDEVFTVVMGKLCNESQVSFVLLKWRK